MVALAFPFVFFDKLIVWLAFSLFLVNILRRGLFIEVNGRFLAVTVFYGGTGLTR
jgi:hypothetical protein